MRTQKIIIVVAQEFRRERIPATRMSRNPAELKDVVHEIS